MNRYLSKEALTPHGAAASVHRIHGIEIGEKSYVTVNSFADENVEKVLWQQTYELPSDALSGEGDPRHNALLWLSETMGGGVIVDGPIDLEMERKIRLQRANDLRDFHIAKGANTPSGRVDTNAASTTNILGLHQEATLAKMEGRPFEITFKFADNVERLVGLEAMLAMGRAVLIHRSACYDRSWQVKDEIAVAGDVETMDNILVDGWPA